MVQINANVNLINAICVYPEFSCFSTLTSLSKNRQGNVNSFCIVQFSRSFFNSSALSGDFVIISHLFGFVKYFLKTFFIFFKLLSNLQRSDFLFESLFIISHSFVFVKRFLELFSKVFRDFLAFSASSLTACLLYHLFHRLSTPFGKKIIFFFFYLFYIFQTLF